MVFTEVVSKMCDSVQLFITAQAASRCLPFSIELTRAEAGTTLLLNINYRLIFDARSNGDICHVALYVALHLPVVQLPYRGSIGRFYHLRSGL